MSTIRTAPAKRIKNPEVARAVVGRTRFENSGRSLYSEVYDTKRGTAYAVFSYGAHWPLLLVTPDGRALTHDEKYSRTTSSHHNRVLEGIRRDGITVERVTLDELRRLVGCAEADTLTPRRVDRAVTA